MKPQSQATLFSRLAAFALIFTCAAIAAAPQAKGSGPTLAITEFTNDAGAPATTISALGDALYAAIDQSGKYTAVGGGPLKVKSSTGGDLLVSALDAASKVGAEEVVTTDLISASGGSVTYRLSAYRVGPLAFIRSQTFTQSSLSPTALRAGFVTDLAALHAPRTASGTIYSLDNGIKADFGEATGAKLGDIYNVVRNSQKVAQAKVVTIDLNSATIEILNPVAGYKPAIGDQLIGVGPQPAIPPAAKTSVNTFSILALVAATGAALLAIGHHGQPAGAGPAPSPTSSSLVAFTVTPSGQTGTAPGPEQFLFTFSQPVNTSGITFTTPTFVSFQRTRSGVVINPAGTPITVLGGATPSFNSFNTVLTINATTLSPGDNLTFTFTSAVTSTGGQSLVTTNITFTASVARHPAAGHHMPTKQGGVPKPPATQGGVLQVPPPPHGGKDPKNPH